MERKTDPDSQCVKLSERALARAISEFDEYRNRTVEGVAQWHSRFDRLRTRFRKFEMEYNPTRARQLLAQGTGR